MKHYSYESLEPGMKESFQRTVTEEMMELFYRISGDNNSMHISAERKGERLLGTPA